MPERSLGDQLDQEIQAMFAGIPGGADPGLRALVEIAGALRDLPRPSFKVRLKSELERKSGMATAVIDRVSAKLQTAAPVLRVKDAAGAMEFYQKAFGAREVLRFDVHGTMAHGELQIGNSLIMLAEASPLLGYPGPESLGGSPMSVHLYVDDVDAFVKQALDSGAKTVRAIEDHFYGDRAGTISDPYGYNWIIATRKEDLNLEEMHRRFEGLMSQPGPSPAALPQRQTLTPYIIVQDAPGLIDFVKHAFGAQEKMRTVGSAGGVHAEVRIGDTELMLGGGAPDLKWRGESRPTALHIYVEDVNAAYERAVEAGGVSGYAPVDHEYGERSGSVTDPFGNMWYIATLKGEKYKPEGLRDVTPYLHPVRAEPVINYLKRSFGAEELEKYATPDGVIHHAKIKIGNSALEMGEAHGPYQPMPSNFYLHVPDADMAYQRALAAGATSTSEPTDQPWGARVGTVKDAFGNEWYIAGDLKK